MLIPSKFTKEKTITYVWLPLFIIGSIFLLFNGRRESYLIINSYHNEAFDFLFKYVTHLGDGILFPILIILLSFFKLRWSMYFLMASILTLLAMYLTKQLIFHGMARPVALFENEEFLYLVDGVKIHYTNCFPSGHTTTAFAAFSLLILTVKNNFLKLLFSLLAILVGFSRVYLSQHFPIDVLFGAFLGIAIALISVQLTNFLGSKYNITLDEKISKILSIRKYDKS